MEITETSTQKLKRAIKKSISLALSADNEHDKNKYAHHIKRFAGELAMREGYMEEEYKLQGTNLSRPITSMKDIYQQGKNLNSTNFDAIRHNAKTDVAAGDSSEDKKKMTKVGELKMDFSKRIDREWAKNMHPESVKKAIADHNEEHGTKFTDLKSAMDHGIEVQKNRLLAAHKEKNAA